MTSREVMVAGDAAAGGPSTGRRSLGLRVLRSPVGLTCLLVLTAIVVAGLLAPWLEPHDPGFVRLERSDVGPFHQDYLLGGDQYGRDILSRLLEATLGTLRASALMLVVAVVLGTTTGMVAGYFGGLVDDVLEWVANVLMALPGFVLLISLYTVIGPNILVAMALLGVLVAPLIFRLVRSLVLSVRHELYIDSARVSGLGDQRIIRRHVLGAIRGPIVIQSVFVLAMGISVQAGLEFLGLGDRTQPSWGGMLQDAFANVYNNRAAVIWPALLIGITTLCLVLLGNIVRDEATASAGRHQQLRPGTRRRLQAQAQASAAGRAKSAAALPENEPSPLVEVRDLVVGYPDSASSVRTVVYGVDLAVMPGEVHGLVGESGSGKSQIVASIMGILPPEAVVLRGAVRFDGADLIHDDAALRQARGRRIAYVPQEPMNNLDPTYTVGQQLTFGLRAVKKMPRTQARSELLALLDRVGIKDPQRVFDQHPHRISGGMAQRVLIAGALAGGPELLIADEPTTALDVTVQAEVLDLLRELQREFNLGMLLVTHNFGVVADICDRVSVMQAGTIVETRSVEELFANPAHEYTRHLLGSMPDTAGLRRPVSAGRGES